MGPTGLTTEGEAVLAGMLSAGVDVTGVNGMTMDFGSGESPARPMSTQVIEAATALQAQVRAAFAQAGSSLDSGEGWAKLGITPMIGQNDVQAETFTLADAAAVNDFARTKGVGLVSMWSLNRDSTCAPPLPTILPVVQNSCSGIDQGDKRFAEVLSANLGTPLPSVEVSATPSRRASPARRPRRRPGRSTTPRTAPSRSGTPSGGYPGGTKVVWHHQVFMARYWTSGVAPDMPVANAGDSPWALVGPVLPGDTPAPLPTLPAGTYPQWDPTQAYAEGARVQVELVPYEAKWWSKGQAPGEIVAGGSPWLLVTPGS